MAVDLHLHSNASDGTDAPAIVVQKAASVPLTAIALTDHDTLSGIPEAMAAARDLPIDLIPGVELSVDHGGVKIHMLAYFIDPGTGPLQDRLVMLRAGREVRNYEIVDRLNRLGYAITMQDVLRHAAGDAIGRPHIADALAAAGMVPDRTEAFRDLLGDGGLAYVERDRLTATEAIILTTESGGVTSIAHPLTIDPGESPLRSIFEDLRDVGLAGIEAYYSEHPPHIRTQLAGVAADLGLVATGGSDCHGSGKPGLEIGTGRGDLVVPDSVLEELRLRRP
ncbi:MAG: PHP domain-containing protein [Actinomycetota bacterium]|nr:PHP domain-containing protein [Actinomycetota bacterium]